MTNLEKYKTASERSVAFGMYCGKYSEDKPDCRECPLFKYSEDDGIGNCEFHWLDLESDD